VLDSAPRSTTLAPCATWVRALRTAASVETAMLSRYVESRERLTVPISTGAGPPIVTPPTVTGSTGRARSSAYSLCSAARSDSEITPAV
jgi:hypothetical protein